VSPKKHRSNRGDWSFVRSAAAWRALQTQKLKRETQCELERARATCAEETAGDAFRREKGGLCAGVGIARSGGRRRE